MTEGHIRSLAKAFSWRVTGSIGTFIVAYIMTGKAILSFSISFIEFFAKIFLYYLHERIWDKIDFDRKRPEYEI